MYSTRSALLLASLPSSSRTSEVDAWDGCSDHSRVCSVSRSSSLASPRRFFLTIDFSQTSHLSRWLSDSQWFIVFLRRRLSGILGVRPISFRAFDSWLVSSRPPAIDYWSRIMMERYYEKCCQGQDYLKKFSQLRISLPNILCS